MFLFAYIIDLWNGKGTGLNKYEILCLNKLDLSKKN